MEHLIQRHNQEMNTTYKGVDSATMRILMSFPWKGNIRELDNVLERAMILGDGEWIKPADLPGQGGNYNEADGEDNLGAALDLFEKIHIERTLNKSAGDKGASRRALGVEPFNALPQARKAGHRGLGRLPQPARDFLRNVTRFAACSDLAGIWPAYLSRTDENLAPPFFAWPQICADPLAN